MPVHIPAPTQPTNKCPKCGTEGVVQNAVGNMTSAYSGIRWGSGQPRQI